MFTYIFNSKTHSDTTREFMLNLGMNTEQIESVLQQKEYEERQNVELRATAYKRESDPLYLEWQYETEIGNPNAAQFKQKWLDKVSEIKARYPLPAEN